MSDNNKQDLLDIAAKAEQDLNSTALQGNVQRKADSATESGIDQGVTTKFPGSTAEYGSHVSGAGDNRDIPESEGGGIQKGTGKLTKAGDFDQGEPGEGPEDVAKRRAEQYGGEDDIRGNVRN